MSVKNKIVRQKFKDSVLKRDRNKCVICKTEDNINVHHITDRTLMPEGGYVKENGISLCVEHLAAAEEYHLSNGDSCAEGFTPKALYMKIGSNYEKALKASERIERHG